MVKKVTLRVLAIVLILGVGAMGLHAVAHWHANSYDEQHCQTCQVAHAAAPQPVAQAVAQAPVTVARFAPVEERSPSLVADQAPSVPRAPPA